MTLTDWEDLLNADVNDRMTRLAFADFLEEQGQDKEAQGWRELVNRGFVPFDWRKWSDTLSRKDNKSTWHMRQNGWVWYHENQAGTAKCGYYSAAEETKRLHETKQAMLPEAVFRKVTTGQDKGAVAFPTLFLAERALALVLMEG